MEYYYLNENSNEVLVENRSGPISSMLVVLVTMVVSSDDFHYCPMQPVVYFCRILKTIFDFPI